MSIVEDARRLDRTIPMIPFGNDQGTCVLCRHDHHTEAHTSDCPWLALPRIVAALEAAEHFVAFNHYQELLGQSVSYRALVAALQGDG